MRRNWGAIITSGSLFLNCGCASNYKTPPIVNTSQPRTETWVKNKWYNFTGADGPRLRSELINPYTYNPSAPSRNRATGRLGEQGESLYALARQTTNPAAARQARNELQNAVLRLSDSASSKHLAGLKASENGANVLLGGASKEQNHRIAKLVQEVENKP